MGGFVEIKLDAAALNQFLRSLFPERGTEGMPHVDMMSPGATQLTLTPHAGHLRPGGIVSGPTLMTLSDTAAYVLILGHIGEQPMAVTSSLSQHFLRPCPFAPVIARASFIKLGRRQAIVDVRIFSSVDDALVGQALVTYALPKSAPSVPQ